MAQGRNCTLGYWDKPAEAPLAVLDQYLQSVQALKAPGYVSVKLTALDYSEELLDRLAQPAIEKGVRVHFDAMSTDTADRTRKSIERLVLRHGQKLQVGYTIAGRHCAHHADEQCHRHHRCRTCHPGPLVRGRHGSLLHHQQEQEDDARENGDHEVRSQGSQARRIQGNEAEVIQSSFLTKSPPCAGFFLLLQASKSSSRNLPIR
jgi:hypothetical protein